MARRRRGPVSLALLAALPAALMVLSQCSSLPDPAEGRSTLVVGAVIMHASGYDTYGSATVNGDHRSGIQITVINEATNEPLTLVSDVNGLFYTTKMPAGSYVVQRLYYRAVSGTWWADTNMSPQGRRRFVVKDGSVNNLGMLTWYNSTTGGLAFEVNSDYPAVHDLVSEKQPKSAWLKMDWTETLMSR